MPFFSTTSVLSRFPPNQPHHLVPCHSLNEEASVVRPGLVSWCPETLSKGSFRAFHFVFEPHRCPCPPPHPHTPPHTPMPTPPHPHAHTRPRPVCARAWCGCPRPCDHPRTHPHPGPARPLSPVEAHAFVPPTPPRTHSCRLPTNHHAPATPPPPPRTTPRAGPCVWSLCVAQG